MCFIEESQADSAVLSPPPCVTLSPTALTPRDTKSETNTKPLAATALDAALEASF